MHRLVVMLSLLMVLGSFVGIIPAVQAQEGIPPPSPNRGATRYGGDEQNPRVPATDPATNHDEGDIGTIFSNDPLRSAALIAVVAIVLGTAVFFYKKNQHK